MSHNVHRIIGIAFLAVVVACAVCMAISAMAGCQQQVDGGSTKHDSLDRDVTIDPVAGVVTWKEHREGAATSQPASKTFGTTPVIGGGGDGEIGGVSFTQMKPTFDWSHIILGSICLLAAGAAYYFTRNLVVTGVALAVGVAAFLVPTMLGLIAVGALVVIVLAHFGFTFKRVVGSVSYGLNQIPNDPIRQAAKSAMEQKQSPADVAAIKALRPATA